MNLICMMKLLICLLTSVVLSPAQCSWWFLSRLQTASVGTSAPAICSLIPGLSRRQRRLCQLHPDAMQAIGEGVHMAVQECQRQFLGERWNCSAVENAGFGRILLKLGSREAAFVYAISSSAVTHSISRACSGGNLNDCQCGRPTEYSKKTKKKIDYNGKINFQWGGCSDNVRFAAGFVRRFVDAEEKRLRSGRSLMNLHNNRAGRKLLRRNLQLRCKCHGVSGSCTTKTCWTAVPNFQLIGQILKQKYRRATQVTISQRGAKLLPFSQSSSVRFDDPIEINNVHHNSTEFDSIRPTRLTEISSKVDRIKRSDLVFFEPSPDYCIGDKNTGSLGTAGRRCNRTSTVGDSCDLLCCGRGYDTKRVVVVDEQCECKFVWCCDVKCKTCRRVEDVHTCKGKSTDFSAGILRKNRSENALKTVDRFRYLRADFQMH